VSLTACIMYAECRMNAALFTCAIIMPMPEFSLLESKICVHIYVITFLNKFAKCVCVCVNGHL